MSLFCLGFFRDFSSKAWWDTWIGSRIRRTGGSRLGKTVPPSPPTGDQIQLPRRISANRPLHFSSDTITPGVSACAVTARGVSDRSPFRRCRQVPMERHLTLDFQVLKTVPHEGDHSARVSNRARRLSNPSKNQTIPSTSMFSAIPAPLAALVPVPRLPEIDGFIPSSCFLRDRCRPHTREARSGKPMLDCASKPVAFRAPIAVDRSIRRTISPLPSTIGRESCFAGNSGRCRRAATQGQADIGVDSERRAACAHLVGTMRPPPRCPYPCQCARRCTNRESRSAASCTPGLCSSGFDGPIMKGTVPGGRRALFATRSCCSCGFGIPFHRVTNASGRQA